jgi:hypothetical protein
MDGEPQLYFLTRLLTYPWTYYHNIAYKLVSSFVSVRCLFSYLYLLFYANEFLSEQQTDLITIIVLVDCNVLLSAKYNPSNLSYAITLVCFVYSLIKRVIKSHSGFHGYVRGWDYVLCEIIAEVEETVEHQNIVQNSAKR